jgi:5'(3')-deoxyribonucleotidase
MSRREVPMEVTRIYFDMGGVLADFDRGVRDLCGLEPVDQMAATNEDNDRLWAAVAKVDHYYGRLEMIPGADAMLRILMEKYGDRVEILTGIPKPKRNIVHAKTDKIQWMRRNFGPDIKVNVVYREEKKERCTGKGDILIDDYRKNIDEWISYGGTGILFQDAESAMQEMRELKIL